MKAAIAVILLVVAVVAVALALHFYPRQPARPQAPPRPVAARPAAQAPSPAQTVASYIEALEDKKYETAYGLLTKESQQKHPYGEFVSQVEKTGVTDYDLSTARAKEQSEARTVVEVQLREDPSSAGFHLAKEGSAWHIAYREGTPSFPYP